MPTDVYARLVLHQPARAVLANGPGIDFCISAGARVELLPTLLRPADFDEARATMDGCQSSASKARAEVAAPSCMDSLGKLNTQCTVFKRSAEAICECSPQTVAELGFVAKASYFGRGFSLLTWYRILRAHHVSWCAVWHASGFRISPCCAAESADPEDVDALTIALEIASAHEQLQESCATFRGASGASNEPGQHNPLLLMQNSPFSSSISAVELVLMLSNSLSLHLCLCSLSFMCRAE